MPRISSRFQQVVLELLEERGLEEVTGFEEGEDELALKGSSGLFEKEILGEYGRRPAGRWTVDPKAE